MLKSTMKNQTPKKTFPKKRERQFKDFSDPNDRFTKIYVGNLVYSMDEGKISKLFSKHGKVGKIQVIRDEKTNRSKGIAFLQMYNREHAENAIQKLNGKEVNGRTLKVSVALEREKKDLKPRNRQSSKNKVEKVEVVAPKRRKRRFNFDFSPK